MSNVIQLVQSNSEPRVDSRQIAGRLGLAHPSTFRLIERYSEEMQRFGLVGFEIGAVKSPGGRGTKMQRFALLNEDQCYFLLSLSRNTQRVVGLKADLVAAFAEARRRGTAQQLTLWQQLMALEVEDKGSAVKGRFGSRLMNERKGDLRLIRPRRRALEEALQPQLALAS